MNELPVLCYVQRALGSPGRKRYKSLEGNVQCEGSVKLFFRQKLRVGEENNAFSPLFYQK